MRMFRPARGFTLIEVTLAILLFALLLAGTYGSIRTAVRSIASGEAAVDRTNRVRVAQEFIRRQVSRAMPLSFGRDEGTGMNYVFEGDRDYIRFVAPMPGYLSKGGPYVQTLEIKGGRGGRQLLFGNAMLNGFDLDNAGEQNEPVVLLDQIEDAHFEFRTLDEEGELADWSDEWEDASITPLMVRLAVRMQPEARVEFPQMEIPLMLDVGAVRRQRPGQLLPGVGLDSGGLRSRSSSRSDRTQ
jgi:general secretion pathway protein J